MRKLPSDNQPAWCPGCGNFPILKTLDEAIEEAMPDPSVVWTTVQNGPTQILRVLAAPACGMRRTSASRASTSCIDHHFTGTADRDRWNDRQGSRPKLDIGWTNPADC